MEVGTKSGASSLRSVAAPPPSPLSTAMYNVGFPLCFIVRRCRDPASWVLPFPEAAQRSIASFVLGEMISFVLVIVIPGSV